MSAPETTVADVQAIIDRSPYLSWLGLKVRSLGPETIEVRASWREEWVANPAIGQTQGGILASLIDFAANFALVGTLGRAVQTVDLRVDYHRMAKKGDLIAKGAVVKTGRQFAVCEAYIHDEAGQLIASGRGAFLLAPVESAGGR